MPTIQLVQPTDTFETWRIRTNDLINTLNLPIVGTVTTIGTRTDAFNITDSASVPVGCQITDNGNGTINVSAGEALLRNAATNTAPLTACQIPATNNIALTDLATNYVYADYNGGAPIVAVTTTKGAINNTTQALIGIVQRDGVNLTILQVAGNTGDFEARFEKRMQDLEGVQIAEGCQLSEPAALPLGVSYTAGRAFYGTVEIPIAAFDSSAAANSIELLHLDAGGNWVPTPTQTLDNVNYNPAAGGLAAIPAGQYATFWIYAKVGHNQQKIYCIYGRNTYGTPDGARTEHLPQNLPPELRELGVLLGRAIVQQGAANVVAFDSLVKTLNFSNAAQTSFDDVSFVIYNAQDTTKKLQFSLTGMLPGKTTTIKVPNHNGQLALLSDVHRYHDEVKTKWASLGMLDARIAPYANTQIEVLAIEDDTDIYVNGFEYDKLNKDQIGVYTLNAGDKISANKPIAVKDAVDGHQFTGVAAVGHYFAFNSIRFSPHKIFVYSPYTDGTVKVYRDARTAANLIGTYAVHSGQIITITVNDAAAPAQNIYFIESDVPVIASKEGTGGDIFTIFPLAREVCNPAPHLPGTGTTIAWNGQQVQEVPGTMIVFDPATKTVSANVQINNTGFYISDDLCTNIKIGDGNGANGTCAIPANMLGDTYAITHDLSGYTIIATEPTIIRVYVADSLYAEHDLTAASKDNPVVLVVGDQAGAPGTAGTIYDTATGTWQSITTAQPLDNTRALLRYVNASGSFQVGETITGQTSGASAVVVEDKGDMLVLSSLSTAATFQNGEQIVGQASGTTADTSSTAYRDWVFKGTATFCLKVNDQYADEYIAVGYNSSLRYPLPQFEQLSNRIHALTDELLAGAKFHHVFDPDLEGEWWGWEAGFRPQYLLTTNEPSTTGGYIARHTNGAVRVYRELIPINPNVLYKFTWKIRLVNVDTTTPRWYYFGSLSYDANKNVVLNGNFYWDWSGWATSTPETLTKDANGWTEITMYIKGDQYSNPSSGWIGTPPTQIAPGKYEVGSITKPRAFDPGAKYFSPVYIFSTNSTTAITDIDYIKVEILPSEVENLNNKVNTINNSIAQPNGLATLDANGRVLQPLKIGTTNGDPNTFKGDGTMSLRPASANHPPGLGHGTLLSYGEGLPGNPQIFIDDFGHIAVRSNSWSNAWSPWRRLVEYDIVGQPNGLATLDANGFVSQYLAQSAHVFVNPNWTTNHRLEVGQTVIYTNAAFGSAAGAPVASFPLRIAIANNEIYELYYTGMNYGGIAGGMLGLNANDAVYPNEFALTSIMASGGNGSAATTWTSYVHNLYYSYFALNWWGNDFIAGKAIVYNFPTKPMVHIHATSDDGSMMRYILGTTYWDGIGTKQYTSLGSLLHTGGNVSLQIAIKRIA